MKVFLAALALLFGARDVQAKGVFAHFMVGNTGQFTVDDWKSDIGLAQAAHINAFALNIAHGDSNNDPQISNAFTAANALGFKLFFSFDYAGGDEAWPKQEVIDLITKYSGNGAYYYRGSQPFVSTFEGPGNALDWTDIKSQTGCFFIPDWSSLGALKALQPGTADGLFSWAAWPTGDSNMTNYVDASYLQFLNGMPYMMPVSPWFFTNMPGYDKNWLWRSDDLWYDRWTEVPDIAPEFIEIISWNDYGESHYIGPLNDKEYVAFGPDFGNSPYNYALDMPHDGWRLFLPYVIDSFMGDTASVTREGLVTWYRTQQASACNDGGTTLNTASQYQLESFPGGVIQDRIFYSALLGSDGGASVTVTVNGASVPGTWSHKPDGGVGVYHGSVPFKSTGDVTVTLSRGGITIASIAGKPISNACTNGIANWNAWVQGQNAAGDIPRATPGLNISEEKCMAGFGVYNFADLCAYTCGYDYCPVGACICTDKGAGNKEPPTTGTPGYPIAGEGASYSGLCSYACNHGHCPPSACGYTEVPLSNPTISPFLPPSCTAGTGDAPFTDLCEFTCQYGFCPIHACKCTATGPLKDFPQEDEDANGTPMPGVFAEDKDYDLCKFACKYGQCDTSTCSNKGFNTKNVCNLPEQPSSWDDSDAGVYLDNWISKNGINDWVNALSQDILGETSGNLDCVSLNAECAIKDCLKDYVASGGEDGASAFWVLLAVQRMHDGFVTMHEKLQDGTINATLHIDKIVSTFDANPPVNPFALAGAAMGIASGAFFAEGGVSGPLGIVSGVFGIASQFYTPPDPTAKVEDQLSQYFLKAEDALQRTLTDALGGPDAETSELPTNAYVPLLGAPTYKTDVANWFRDGSWLYKFAYETFDPIIQTGIQRLQQALIIQILKSQGKFLWARTDVKEKDCTDPAIWMDNLCFRIYNRPTSIGSGNPGSGTACAVDGYSKDLIHTIQDDYKLNMADMYQNAYDCEKANPNKDNEFDASDILYDGTIPKCFFNLGVIKAPRGTGVDCFGDSVPL